MRIWAPHIVVACSTRVCSRRIKAIAGVCAALLGRCLVFFVLAVFLRTALLPTSPGCFSIKELPGTQVGIETFRANNREKEQRERRFGVFTPPAQAYFKDSFVARLPTLSSVEFVRIFLLVCGFSGATMMFTGFNTECDSSSRCSTASPSVDKQGYHLSPAGSYSSLGSPQSQVCPCHLLLCISYDLILIILL